MVTDQEGELPPRTGAPLFLPLLLRHDTTEPAGQKRGTGQRRKACRTQARTSRLAPAKTPWRDNQAPQDVGPSFVVCFHQQREDPRFQLHRFRKPLSSLHSEKLITLPLTLLIQQTHFL